MVSNRCSLYAAPAVPAPLRVFYVNADTGNDVSDGLSPATAWKTLQKANNTAVAGDLFLLRGVFGTIPGTGDGQWINPNNSGTEQNKITYKKEPGYTAIVETGRFTAAIALSQKSHIVIDGLELRNVGIPFVIGENSSSNWLRNLYVHEAGSSLLRTGANSTRIEDSVFVNIGNPQDNSGDTITLLNDTDSNVVVRNYFGNAGHGAYDDTVQGSSTGYNENNIVAQNIFNNEWATNVILSGRAVGTLVECNEIKNASINTPNPSLVYPRPGIQLSGKNSIIRYNTIHHNKSDGIIMQGYIFATTQQQYPENNQIYHNTIVNNGRSGLYIGASDSGYPSAQAYVRNNTFENNLLYGNYGADGANGSRYDIAADFYSSNVPWSATFNDGNIIRYNNASNLPFFILVRNASSGGNLAYSTPAAVQTVYTNWTNNLQANPLFVNGSANNYALQSTSPMIDAGRIIPGVIYTGSAPDLGAIEYSGTSSAQTPYPGPGIPNVPAVIEAENYDNGGEGTAYHDLDTANNGNIYRQDGVDVSARTTASNGYMVFNASAGEWLEYTINAPAAGSYDLGVTYASEFNNGKFHVEVDGFNVTGALTANSTGNWGTFQTVVKNNVALTAGTHVIRLSLDLNSPDSCNCVVGNFDKLTFTPVAGPQLVTWQNVQGTSSSGGTVQHNGTVYFGMARTVQTITSGQAFEWTHSGQPDIWVGLNNNNSEQPGTAYFDLPYGFNGTVREFGAFREEAFPVPGDRLQIAIAANGIVSFKKNGTLIYTSTVAASGSYYLVFKAQETSGKNIADAVKIQL